MNFKELELKGAYIIAPKKVEDERGFFARMWDKKIFEEKNLNSNLVQCNISFNKKKGTLRGIHYQVQPYEEAKLIRCTRGGVFEVLVDLRRTSKTFKKWIGIELDSNDHMMLYVPEGIALGMQTLEDNTELFYQMSQVYMPSYARGIRWNDREFNISWPQKITVISKKDLSYADFRL